MLPESWVEIRSEARFLPTYGCKSMIKWPVYMLHVFTTLLYTYVWETINIEAPTFTIWGPNVSESCFDFEILPGPMLKKCYWSRIERPTNMLGVFITLVHTSTIPMNHYTLVPTWWHTTTLDGQTLPEKASTERQETLQHVGVQMVWIGPQTSYCGCSIPIIHPYNTNQAL